VLLMLEKSLIYNRVIIPKGSMVLMKSAFQLNYMCSANLTSACLKGEGYKY